MESKESQVFVYSADLIFIDLALKTAVNGRAGSETSALTVRDDEEPPPPHRVRIKCATLNDRTIDD